MSNKAHRLELNYAAKEDIDVAIASCEPSLERYVGQFEGDQKAEVILRLGTTVGVLVQEYLQTPTKGDSQISHLIVSPEVIDDTAKAEAGLKWLANTAQLAGRSQEISS